MARSYDRTYTAPNRDRVKTYQDTSGEWRWTRFAVNGRKVADSGESYRTRFGARRAAKREAKA